MKLYQSRRWVNAVNLSLLLTIGMLFVIQRSDTTFRNNIEEYEYDREAESSCRGNMRMNLLPPMPTNPDDMLTALFTYITAPHPDTCVKLARVGGAPLLWLGRLSFDGYKYICLDGETELLRTDRCLVYSFGISSDWSFDWDMEAFGCDVFAFDPSVNVSSGSQGGSISFMHVGLAAEDSWTKEGWRLYSLDSLVDKLGHRGRTIHYLKVDIDDYEWKFLRESTRNSNSVLLTNVRQIGMELHFYNHMPFEENVDFYTEVYQSFLIMQRHGFYMASYDPNVFVKRFTEVEGVEAKVPVAVEVVWIKSTCKSPSDEVL